MTVIWDLFVRETIIAGLGQTTLISAFALKEAEFASREKVAASLIQIVKMALFVVMIIVQLDYQEWDAVLNHATMILVAQVENAMHNTTNVV